MFCSRKSRPERYEIRIDGALDRHWADWFEGLTLAAGPEGETVLTGRLPDQSALHGVLRRIEQLGLTLLSVRAVEVEGGEGRP